MAAEQEQSPNLLDFNNKQENNGTNNRGRLTAHEFNQLINAVGNLSFDVIENEEAFEQIESKDENTVYFILEE